MNSTTQILILIFFHFLLFLFVILEATYSHDWAVWLGGEGPSWRTIDHGFKTRWFSFYFSLLCFLSCHELCINGFSWLMTFHPCCSGKCAWHILLDLGFEFNPCIAHFIFISIFMFIYFNILLYFMHLSDTRWSRRLSSILFCC